MIYRPFAFGLKRHKPWSRSAAICKHYLQTLSANIGKQFIGQLLQDFRLGMGMGKGS